MNLQTKIQLEQQSNNLIDYNSNVLLLGSCFSENIGNKLEYFKFLNLQNPFGILFHPKAIECLITNAINKKVYTEEDVFYQNEKWHCFDSHSKLSNTSKKELLKALNAQINLTYKQICESTHVIITLGTAWVYKEIKTNNTVANCHKVHQKQFKKELLSIDAINQSLENIIVLIKSVNSKASILFTVSPVRHLKDGFVENTQSKAHLISAIHKCMLSLGVRVHYFPSYEIMMDELRDYRFYSEDMIHPNQTAINYIWETFQNIWVSKDALKTMDEVDAIQKGLQHKPFNLQSQSHRQFLQKLEAKKVRLQKQFSNIKF